MTWSYSYRVVSSKVYFRLFVDLRLLTDLRFLLDLRLLLDLRRRRRVLPPRITCGVAVLTEISAAVEARLV